MGILLLPPLRRSWTSAFATTWLGLALAILRAFHAFFASPSQDILSGFWGGCSIGLLTEPLRINYYWPTSNCLQLFLVQIIHPQSSFLFLSHLRTSRSGVGAFLQDFTKALFFHICVYLYFFPLWRRCFPSGFHQSPRLVHTVLLPGFCLPRVCGWFFGFWPCCMFLTKLGWCMTSFCAYGHGVYDARV